MKLTGIISISGKPGLSKIVMQSRTGIIVESLIDGKRFPVQGTERVSSLEDISIYTYEEDVLLAEVFEKMKKHTQGKQAISHKNSTADLLSEFEKVLPNYDQERVYTSDIKKVFQWFNILLEKGLLEEEDKKEETEESKATEVKTKKETQKPVAKKTKEPTSKKKSSPRIQKQKKG